MIARENLVASKKKKNPRYKCSSKITTEEIAPILIAYWHFALFFKPWKKSLNKNTFGHSSGRSIKNESWTSYRELFKFMKNYFHTL